MAFHDQANQALPLIICLGQELFGGGENRFGVRFHLDLRHGFHCHSDALLRVQVLLRGHVEGHQFERKLAADLHHRQHHRAMTFDHAGSAESINDQRLVRSRFAIDPGHPADQEQNDHDRKRDEDPNFYCMGYFRHNASLNQFSVVSSQFSVLSSRPG